MTMWIYRRVNPAEKIMRSCLKTTPYYLPSMYISTKNLYLKRRSQHFHQLTPSVFFSCMFHSFIPWDQRCHRAFRQWQVQATKSIAHGAKGPRLVKGGPPLHLAHWYDTGRLDAVSSKGVKIDWTAVVKGLSSWWLNQPIWKIISQKSESSPGVNIKNIWNHHLDYLVGGCNQPFWN